MTSFKTNTYSIKSEGKSFYWASIFLPKKSRVAASKLYSICRYLDDVADNSKLDTSSQIKDLFKQVKENEASEINTFFKQKCSLLVGSSLFRCLLKPSLTLRDFLFTFMDIET